MERVVYQKHFQNAQQNIEVIVKTKKKPKISYKTNEISKPFVRDCALKKELDKYKLESALATKSTKIVSKDKNKMGHEKKASKKLEKSSKLISNTDGGINQSKDLNLDDVRHLSPDSFSEDIQNELTSQKNNNNPTKKNREKCSYVDDKKRQLNIIFDDKSQKLIYALRERLIRKGDKESCSIIADLETCLQKEFKIYGTKDLNDSTFSDFENVEKFQFSQVQQTNEKLERIKLYQERKLQEQEKTIDELKKLCIRFLSCHEQRSKSRKSPDIVVQNKDTDLSFVEYNALVGQRHKLAAEAREQRDVILDLERQLSHRYAESWSNSEPANVKTFQIVKPVNEELIQLENSFIKLSTKSISNQNEREFIEFKDAYDSAIVFRPPIPRDHNNDFDPPPPTPVSISDVSSDQTIENEKI